MNHKENEAEKKDSLTDSLHIVQKDGRFSFGWSFNEGGGTQVLTGGWPFVLPYMQTWVDNETWRAPVRLDIVIEDEPTEAATQVRAGCDFVITIF